jgi:ribosomal protein L11 methyltransferase
MRLAIRVREADAELTLARLLPVLHAGAEERDVPGAVEYALYGDRLPGEAELRALAGDALLSVELTQVPDGWERAWHAHLVRVGAGGFFVRPPWVAGAADDLVIDPGDAFGAGGHATTRLCLERLSRLPAGGPLCDWGTGTGVLAIAAARLGFGPVSAVDVDPVAVRLAGANAAANGVAVAVAIGDVTAGGVAAARAAAAGPPAAAATLAAPPWAPTAVANLTLPLLQAAAAAVSRPPRTLLASGVLAAQADATAAAWAARGLVERERRELDGWAALVLEAG